MYRFLQRLSRRRAASGVEYALLVALIAVVALGAVKATGETARTMFCTASAALAQQAPEDNGCGSSGAPDEPATPAPDIHIDLVNLEIGYGQVSSLSWAVTGATSLSATSRYSGSCEALDIHGGDLRALSWGGIFNGTDSFSWSAEIAGCSEEICVWATGPGGAAQACRTIAYASWDNEPEPFDFVDVDDAAPSTLIVSQPVTLTGFDGTLSVAIDNQANGAEYRVAGGDWVASGGTIAAGQSLEIRIVANAEFAQSPATPEMSRTVKVTVGVAEAIWAVVNAPQDTSPNPFAFPSVVSQTISTTKQSNIVSLDGFTGTLTLKLTPIGDGATYFAYDTDIGTLTQITGPVAIEVSAGTTLQLEITTSDTWSESHSIAVELGDYATTWTVANKGYALASLADFVDITGATHTPGVSQSSNTITIADGTGFGGGKLLLTLAGFANSASSDGYPASTYHYWLNGVLVCLCSEAPKTLKISSGATLRLALTASDVPNEHAGIIVSVGGLSRTWDVINSSNP